MEILAFSDCHGILPEVTNVGYDTLCIAGDICPDYRPVRGINNRIKQMEWVRDTFVPWLNAITIPNKVVVFGNHDWFSLEAGYTKELTTLCKGVRFLFDSSVTIGNVKFWGSPRTPTFTGWAWETTEENLALTYADIPADTNVIISHAPPRGYSDDDKGSTALRAHIDKTFRDSGGALKLVLCGHIHEGAGISVVDKAHNYPLKIANVSLVDELYNRVRDPQDFNVDPDVKWGHQDLHIKL